MDGAGEAPDVDVILAISGLARGGGQERPGVLGPAAATLCPVQGCWPRIGALCSDWLLGAVLAASGPQEPVGEGASEAWLGGCPGPHWLQGASS